MNVSQGRPDRGHAAAQHRSIGTRTWRSLAVAALLLTSCGSPADDDRAPTQPTDSATGNSEAPTRAENVEAEPAPDDAETLTPTEKATELPAPVDELSLGDTMIVALGGEAVVDLSGEWLLDVATFVRDSAFDPATDTADYRTVDVPGRWTDQGIPVDKTASPVAVYRRTFAYDADWTGLNIGVSAWLYPGHSRVAVNGTLVEPSGAHPDTVAEITHLLTEGDNTIVVATQFDGIYESATMSPPRVGPLTSRPAADAPDARSVEIEADGDTIPMTIYGPDRDHAVLLIGTGSHGFGFGEPLVPLAVELTAEGLVPAVAVAEGQSAPKLAALLDALTEATGASVVSVFAVSDSANALLDLLAERPRLGPSATLSATNTAVSESGVPVLVMAPTRDTRVPSGDLAPVIAESLGPNSRPFVFAASGNGLRLLESHWNAIRHEVVSWLLS